MLYLPRKRSITRYFRFTSFQLRTENFAAAPPAFAVPRVRCCGELPHLPNFSVAFLLAGECSRWISAASSGFDVLPDSVFVPDSTHSFLRSLDSFPPALSVGTLLRLIFPSLHIVVTRLHLLLYFLFYSRRCFFSLSVFRDSVQREPSGFFLCRDRACCGAALKKKADIPRSNRTVAQPGSSNG